MDVRHGCALALLVLGAAALLLSALALLVLPTPYARLHALAPASSLGLPLVCLALALDAGPGRAVVKLLFIGVLTAFCGPLLSIAIGRTLAYDPDPPATDADTGSGSGSGSGPGPGTGTGSAPVQGEPPA